MAKGGKLTKLKSALKKWPSFTKHSRNDQNDIISKDVHPVYVGKSRRRYLVCSDIVEHPVFQELACDDSDQYGIVVACEVVMFEHLLWMLENNGTELGSVDELAEYYTC